MHRKLENKKYLQDNNNPDNNNNINIQYTYCSTLKYKAITKLVSFDTVMVFQNLPGDEKQKVIVPNKTVTVCTVTTVTIAGKSYTVYDSMIEKCNKHLHSAVSTFCVPYYCLIGKYSVDINSSLPNKLWSKYIFTNE